MAPADADQGPYLDQRVSHIVDPHAEEVTSMQGQKAHVDVPMVIAGVDHSEAALGVLQYAAAEAETHALALRIVHVATLFGGENIESAEGSLRDERSLWAMRRQVRGIAGPGLRARRTATSFAVRHGSVIGELIASAQPGSRVVVGADRLESGRSRGVVAAGLAARLECPLIVVPRTYEGGAPDGRVVVGFKDRWESTQALDAGFEEAARRGLPLVITHARWSADATNAADTELRHLDDLIAERRSCPPPVALYARTVHGDFVPVMRKVLTQRDLLVIGRSSAWTTHPALGPAGSDLLEDPPCPVLVVPAPSEVGGTSHIATHPQQREEHHHDRV